MTTAEAKTLNPGQYVDYLGVRAMVRAVRANGVIVDYWCPRRIDTCVVRRVSATYLKAL